MGSRWSSSPMTKGTSRRQRRAACWCTNVSAAFFRERKYHGSYRNLSCVITIKNEASLLSGIQVTCYRASVVFVPLSQPSLPSILGEEYVKSLIANPELVDRLALSNDDMVNTCTILNYLHKETQGNSEIVCRICICMSGSHRCHYFVAKLYWTSFSLFSLSIDFCFLSSLRMKSQAVRCYSQSTFLCPRSKQDLRVAPSSRAPLGPAGTTIWRPQSLSRERRKTAQRCVCTFVCKCAVFQQLSKIWK